MIDENSRPGGQLFKQIHKFFGSKRHHAGIRGTDIGRELLDEAEAHNEVLLGTLDRGLEDALSSVEIEAQLEERRQRLGLE